MKNLIFTIALGLLISGIAGAQTSSQYHAIDVTEMNKELMNNDDPDAYEKIFQKYCPFYPKNYKIEGSDEYHNSSVGGSLNNTKMHLKNLENTHIQEMKLQIKSTTKNGYTQVISLKASYLCTDSQEWSSVICN